MYKTVKFIVTLFLIGLLSSCSSVYQPIPDQLDLKEDSMVSVTAVLSQTFIRGKESNYRICAQPMPDAVFDQSGGADISVSVPGMGSEEVGEKEGSNQAEMSGRTPAVLMAREMFYRACEFSTNFNLPSDQASEVYLKTLEVISKGWLVEEGNTSVTIGATVESASNVTVQDVLKMSDADDTSTKTENTSTKTDDTSTKTDDTSTDGETNNASDPTSSTSSSASGEEDDDDE